MEGVLFASGSAVVPLLCWHLRFVGLLLVPFHQALPSSPLGASFEGTSNGNLKAFVRHLKDTLQPLQGRPG